MMIYSKSYQNNVICLTDEELKLFSEILNDVLSLYSNYDVADDEFQLACKLTELIEDNGC